MFDDLEHRDTGGNGLDADQFRQVVGRFCTGVTIITGVDGRDPVGFTAQSFVSVSLDPPLVSFCPAKTVASWARIRRSGTFCVNILSDRQEALCRTFAIRGQEKFRGVRWRPAPASGAPILEGVIGWIEGQVVDEHDAGDHLIVVGSVLGGGGDEDGSGGGSPLLFYRGTFGRFES